MRTADVKRTDGLQSSKAICAKCDAEVWVAPSTIELRSLIPDAEIICNRCFEKEPIGDDVKFAITEKAIQEFNRIARGVHNN